VILVDHDIQVALAYKEIEIDPFDPANLQAASYDVRLSPEIRRIDPRIEVLDPSMEQPYSFSEVLQHAFILHPGEFILASSVERIRLPDHMVAQLAGKSSLARLGVQIESAGFFDPGWNGQATMELVNLTQRPVRLFPHMKIAQLVFATTTSAAVRPYGHPELGSKYQNQEGPTPSAMWKEDPPE
jgi:dCTP deaminase